MTLKTRLLLLASCAVIFLIITPYIVLYSLGYRVDFKNFKIRGTGGIYVYAQPAPSSITIDSKIPAKGGLFSSAVFVQNLMPGLHSVLIKKDGYYDYQKTLQVQEQEVTKLEHVNLFKKNIAFQILPSAAKSPFPLQPVKDGYLLQNNILYRAAANTNLPQNQTTPVVKNIIAYTTLNNTIIWLGLDGFLYQYNVDSKETNAISLKIFTINKKNTYRLTAASATILLQENQTLFLLNPVTKIFENFYSPVNKTTLSPNGQTLLFYNDHEITYSSLETIQTKVFLNKFPAIITDCQWLNDDYILCNIGGHIIISEIDVRGNINSIELPQKIFLPDGTFIETKNPQIFFNQQDKKLYILSGANVIVSERLVP